MTEQRFNMTFSVIWHCYHSYKHHVVPMALSTVLLHSFQDDWNKVFWCHWHQHWHHVILTASSIGKSYLLGQGNWNEVLQYVLFLWDHWCWHWHHVMLVALSIAHCIYYVMMIRTRCNMNFMIMQCHWATPWLLCVHASVHICMCS